MPSLPGEDPGWSHLREAKVVGHEHRPGHGELGMDSGIDLDLGMDLELHMDLALGRHLDMENWAGGILHGHEPGSGPGPGISPGVVHGHLSSPHVTEPLVLLLSCSNSCTVLVL